MRTAHKKQARARAVARERLEARISVQQKKLFVRAAALKGQTLTDFVVGSLQAAADQTVEEHEAMRLGVEERERFVEALIDPPAPNAGLRRAAERYWRRLGR